MANVTIKRYNGSAWDIHYPKTIISQVVDLSTALANIQSDINTKAHKDNSVFYVDGNTAGTAGYWTGSIPEISALYTGIKIAYKIGINGASNTYLNINSYGNILVRRNTGNLTTHLPIGTIVFLVYDGTYWVWADYDSTDPYLDAFNSDYSIGGTIYQYKLVMMGSDGKLYPLTLENTTAATKTISSVEFIPKSQVYTNRSNGTYTAGTNSMRYYLATRLRNTNFHYTCNGYSTLVMYKPIYIVGSINQNGNFVLKGAGTNSNNDFISQTLPTTDDGYIYIFIGTIDNAQYYLNLHEDQVWYQFKNGKIREYISETITSVTKEMVEGVLTGAITSHSHGKAQITNFDNEVLSLSPAGSRPASDVSAWAKAASKPSYSWGEIGSKPTNIMRQISFTSGVLVVEMV